MREVVLCGGSWGGRDVCVREREEFEGIWRDSGEREP